MIGIETRLVTTDFFFIKRTVGANSARDLLEISM